MLLQSRVETQQTGKRKTDIMISTVATTFIAIQLYQPLEGEQKMTARLNEIFLHTDM